MAKYLLICLFALVIGFKNVAAKDNSSSCMNTINSACQAHAGFLIEFPINYTSPGREVKWPTSEKEISTYCTQMDDLQKCLRNLINPKASSSGAVCTEELIEAKKMTIMLSVYFKSVCITQKRRQDALKRLECYKKPEVQNAVQPIVFRAFAMAMLPSIGNDSSVTSTDHQSWCCAMLYFRDNVYKVNQKHCKPEITEEIHHLVQDVIGPTYHESCGRATTYAQCFKELSPVRQEMFQSLEGSSQR